MRDQLLKSYAGAKIPAFDTNPFKDKNVFEGLRWVMKTGIDLQGLKLSLTAKEVVSFVVTDIDLVLWHLVDLKLVEIAAKSKAKDTTHYWEELEEEVPTLFMAADRVYANVVRSLMKKEVNADAMISNGLTSLHNPSFMGQVEVVRVLLEREADINKAMNDGTTPLQIANHTEIIQLLQLAAQNQPSA